MAESGNESEPRPAWHGPRLSRRQVLTGLGAGYVVAQGARLSTVRSLERLIVERTASTRSAAAPDVTLVLIRRDDMLNLVVDGWNLQVVGPNLERIATGDAFVVLTLDGQYVLEKAILLGDPVPTPGPSIDRVLAAPTRLAFKVPDGTSSIPITADALLDWTAWEPSLAATALPPNPGPPPIVAPALTETAIEAPWQLVVSPDQTGRWAHSSEPVTHAQGGATWVELWHTILGTDDGSGGVNVPPRSLPFVRAIWTPGYPTPPSEPFDPVSLTAGQRAELVRNTSAYVDDLGNPRAPTPARAELLMLTPLGASFNLGGFWPTDNLIAWTHRASLGRDTFVRVVERGYLYPFGHPASLVTITERIFAADAAGDVVAYLRQREFVVVRQARLDFTAAPFDAVGDPTQRQMPFRALELTTLVTPDLDMTSNSQTDVSGALTHPDCFWLVAGGTDVAFRVRATDWIGRVVDFDAPAIFVKAGAPTVNVYDPTQGGGGVAGMAAVRDAFVVSANDPRRARDFNGQTVAFAAPGDPGDTDANVDTINFDSAPWAGDQSADAGAFFAVLSEDGNYGADVHLQAVQAVLGQDLPLRVVYSDAYLTDGFGGVNQGDSFLEVPPSFVKKLDTPVKNSGGMATPTQDVEVITRDGPKGDRANAKAGHFDPTTVFPDDAKLLGGIRLKDTLVNVADPAKAKEEGLSVKSVPITDFSLKVIGIRTTLTFRPELQPDPLGILEIEKDNLGQLKSKLTLEATLTTWYDQPDAAPEATVHGELESVKFHMLGKGPAEFFILGIASMTFDIRADGSFSMDLDLDPQVGVAFGSALEFIADLAKIVPGGIPFKIEMKQNVLDIHTDLPVLGLTVGAFEISNLKFQLGMLLPFDGSPVRFEVLFSEKDNPFIIAYSLIGGGAYVEIVLGADGVERLAIGFSFGAIAELNLGIASAGVTIMIGIDFQLETSYDKNKVPKQVVTLVGYFRAVGVVRLLGLVTITIEIYIALAYKSVGKAYGRARFSISVSVSFFSISIGIDIERQLVGASDDPTFPDQFSSSDWNSYCAAFAA
jgi:hypothetical protein